VTALGLLGVREDVEIVAPHRAADDLYPPGRSLLAYLLLLGLGRAHRRSLDTVSGESYRAQEWGLAILRTSQWLRDPAGYIAPADRWGDLGAATGTALAMLPIAAWQRGYAEGPLALLFAGSDAGRRAAVVLERPLP
jgi:hypothetical protein